MSMSLDLLPLWGWSGVERRARRAGVGCHLEKATRWVRHCWLTRATRRRKQGALKMRSLGALMRRRRRVAMPWSRALWRPLFPRRSTARTSHPRKHHLLSRATGEQQPRRRSCSCVVREHPHRRMSVLNQPRLVRAAREPRGHLDRRGLPTRVPKLRACVVEKQRAIRQEHRCLVREWRRMRLCAHCLCRS